MPRSRPVWTRWPAAELQGPLRHFRSQGVGDRVDAGGVGMVPVVGEERGRVAVSGGAAEGLDQVD